MSDRSRDIGLTILLCVAWIAAALAVNPVGDYPLVDDWAYALSVRALVTEGVLRFSDWGAANLVSQVLWGSGFAALFGYSPTVLRVSTLVAGLIGALALYRLFRLAKAGPGAALLGAVVGGFNPLYFALSFSFMTDVPYAAMQLVAMWLLAGGVLLRRPLHRALGWIVGLAALLCRQLGVFIPVALAVEAGFRRPLNLRRILLAGLPILAFVGVQLAYTHWLKATGRAPEFYGRQINDIWASLAHHPFWVLNGVLKLPVLAFYYLGLFALPLTITTIPACWAAIPPTQRRTALVAVCLAALAAAAAPLLQGTTFPMWGDTLNMASGLGVETVGTPIPGWASVLLTIASGVGGTLLVVALAASIHGWWTAREEGFSIPVFAMALSLMLMGSIALVIMRFDRYLIPVLPCALLAISGLLATRPPGPRALAAGFAAAMVMALISIGATHDFLAAKRVQWQAYTALTRHVPSSYVDAGWVINGSVQFERYGDPLNLRSWYERADYLVGVRAKPGYRVVATYPIQRWLPWNRDGKPMLVQTRLAEHRPLPAASGERPSAH